MKRLLCLTYRPPEKFGDMCAYGQDFILTVLKEKYEIKCLSFSESESETEELITVKTNKNLFRKIFWFVFAGRSPRVTNYSSYVFENKLAKLIAGFDPDIIYAEHVLIARYLLKNKFRAKTIFYDDESCLYIEANNLRKNFTEKIRNIGIGKLEKKIIAGSNLTLTITHDEANYLAKLSFGNVKHLPYGVDTNYYAYGWKNDSAERILFVGNFSHYPNREAVKILLKSILPNLKKNVVLTIVGRNTNLLKITSADRIEIYDNVEDIRPYYWNSRVFVAPILSGGGMRIKILEAASCGIPILMTPVANLGIHLKNNESAVISDDINLFPSLLGKMLDDPSLLSSVSKNARACIEENFSEAVTKSRILRLFDEFEKN